MRRFAWSLPDDWTQYRSRHWLMLLGIGVLLAHIVLFSTLPLSIRGAMNFFLLSLPGLLAAQLLFDDVRDLPTRAVLSLCMAIASQALLMLFQHVLIGPIRWWMVLLNADLLSLLLAWALFRKPMLNFPPTRGRWSWWRALGLSLVLGLASYFRLRYLGNAEFQGDEANVVLLAVDSVIGHEAILLLHRKGPVEILLVVGQLAVLNQINEWLARLPFALSGIGVVLGSYVLARRMLRSVVGEPAATVAGLVAGTILALDGYLLAFSRMVQYQNVVMLMTMGALWCGWRFYSSKAHAQRYLLIGALFAAVAGLSHYDGGFMALALVWLAFAGAWRHGWRWLRWLAGLLPAFGLLFGLLAVFYVPFMMHDNFQRTLSNLMKRTGQQGKGLELFNNLLFYEHLATFYNSRFQIYWLGAALALALLAWLWRYSRPRWLGVLLMGLFGLGCVMLVRAPERLQISESINVAIVLFGLPLLALCCMPRTPSALRVLLLWFSLPLISEAFLISDPKTHFYTMEGAAALLIGTGFAQGWAQLARMRLGWLRPALAAPALALLGLALPYQYIVYVRQVPEYLNVYPAARPELYRTRYGDKLPRNAGYFGFPHRAGWRVVGELYRQGVFQGTFESNEDYLITLWYIGRIPRCSDTPDYYFLARTPMDSSRVPYEHIQQNYHLFGTVMVDGQPQLDIYSRLPVEQAQTFNSSDYIDVFDERRVINLPEEFLSFELVAEQVEPVEVVEGARLTESKVRTIDMVAGQYTTLTMQWEADQALPPDSRVYVDLVNQEGEVVNQIPSMCLNTPPSDWWAYASTTTTFSVVADPSIPPGEYTLRASVRTPDTPPTLQQNQGVTVARLKVEPFRAAH